MRTLQIFLYTVLVMLIAGFISVQAVSAQDKYPRENAVVRAVKNVSPAVVNISTQYEVSYRVNPFSRFGMDDFFRDFFDYGPGRKRRLSSLGSGVIIDGENGYILTNSHVIVKSGTITAVLNDGRELPAEIVGADPESDLAVLRIKAEEPLPAIEMGNSDDLMIGETVIAIGNPFGFSHTVTTGVISALNRSFKAQEQIYRDFIQTDASINPGNSGGPLLNINGELIGINTAIYRNAEGIGFAIPINRAEKIVSDLIDYGEVVHAWIGLFVGNLDRKTAEYFSLDSGSGVFVQAVTAESPAEKAGIRQGDIVVSMQGKPVERVSDYQAAMRGINKGDIVTIRVFRGGTEKEFQARAALFPKELAPELARRLFGVEVVDISDKNGPQAEAEADTGVVITDIESDSALGKIGVRPGDVIRKIDEIEIDGINAFYDAVIKYRWKDSVVVLVQRGYRGYYITVNIKAE